MTINAKTVVRVIIEGEWIWVERGTFTVIPFEFVDDDGNVLSPSKTPAYFFTSTNGDPYYGPLSAISLMKLDSQMLEETDSGPKPRGRPLPLGTGDGSAPTGGGLVADATGATVAAAAPTDDGGGAAAEAPEKKKKPVALFVEDIVEDDEPEPEPDESAPAGEPVEGDDADPDPTEPTAGRRRGGGLF